MAKRLETNKEQLWQIFQNCANQVGGTQMLHDEVLNLLEKHMFESFQMEGDEGIS